MSAPAPRPLAMEFRSVRLSAVEAEVQVLWRGAGAPADLTGWASGPMSSRTKTVPSRYRLLPPRPDDPATQQADAAAREASRAAGVAEEPPPAVVGRFVIEDPCYWRPGSPYLYRVRLDSPAAGLHVDDALGLRWLETTRSGLRCGGEPWFFEGLRPDFSEKLSPLPASVLEALAVRGLAWAPNLESFEAVWSWASYAGLGLIADGAAFSSNAEFLLAAAEPSVLLVQDVPPAAVARLAQLDGPLVAEWIEGEGFLVRPATSLAGAPCSSVRIRPLVAPRAASLDGSERLALRQETETSGCGGWMGELGCDREPRVRGFEPPSAGS